MSLQGQERFSLLRYHPAWRGSRPLTRLSYAAVWETHNHTLTFDNGKSLPSPLLRDKSRFALPSRGHSRVPDVLPRTKRQLSETIERGYLPSLIGLLNVIL